LTQSWTNGKGADMLPNDAKGKIEDVVQRLPEFLRTDLLSKDPATRQCAEEIVAAKILAALHDKPDTK
jgi:hypothetical protein